MSTLQVSYDQGIISVMMDGAMIASGEVASFSIETVSPKKRNTLDLSDITLTGTQFFVIGR